MHLRQHVDQKLRLRAVVWGIAVDPEEGGQAVDQVIDRGREVGSTVSAAPLIEKKAVAFILLERGGIEDAKNVVVDAHGIDFVDTLAGGAPVERIYILQDGQDFRARQFFVQYARKVSWGEVRFAEQREDHGVGVALANLGNLGRGVTVAGADLAQVFARHAIETIDRLGVIAGRDQKFVKRRPVVSPVEIKADSLTQFVLIDFAAPPLFEDVLIAGKDGFDSEHDRTISG